MKSIRGILVLSAILVPISAYAQSGGGQQTTSGVTVSSTSVVTVTVPAVIGIDVESDMAFTFTPTSGVHANNCANNTFPPPLECSAVVYTPVVTTTAGLSNTTPGDLWIAIFSNKSGVEGSMDVKASVQTAFGGGGPGFTAGAIRLKKGTTNSAVGGATVGPTPAKAITALTAGSLLAAPFTSSTFGWSRVDLTPDLSLPGTTVFNAGTFNATLAFTISY
jgi:hypothetical protein